MIADAAYDADRLRSLIADGLGAEAQIKHDRNRAIRHPIDWPLYKGRNLVERFFNRIKLINLPSWQWCARSERGPYKRLGWTFPDRDRCVQRERDLEDAVRRAAQHVGHGFFRPMHLCPDDCLDCPSVVILPPEEVDR